MLFAAVRTSANAPMAIVLASGSPCHTRRAISAITMTMSGMSGNTSQTNRKRLANHIDGHAVATTAHATVNA